MRFVALALGTLLSLPCFGNDSAELPTDRITSLVSSVTEASNRMMREGSKLEDVDALFAMYTDDFVYIHDAYGGMYTRERLYGNSKSNLSAGRYTMTQERYKILNVMVGLNAAAVERLEVESGKVHLSVFEFKGDKVSKITEYWK